MRLFVGDSEIAGAVEFDFRIARDFRDPTVDGLAFRSSPREVTTSISLLESEAAAVLDAFGNPGRIISFYQGFHYSRRQRFWHWLLRIASRWLIPPLPTEIRFTVEGMRPVRMTRHGGVVDVEFSNREDLA